MAQQGVLSCSQRKEHTVLQYLKQNDIYLLDPLTVKNYVLYYSVICTTHDKPKSVDKILKDNIISNQSHSSLFVQKMEMQVTI